MQPSRPKHLLIDILLNEREALEYIKLRLCKEISGRTYRRYKEDARNGRMTQEWLTNYTKVGFIVQHHELLDCAINLLANTTVLLEQEKHKHKPNFYKFCVLMRLMVDHIKLVEDLKIGTPIMAQIKSEKDHYKQKLEEAELKLVELGNKKYATELKLD